MSDLRDLPIASFPAGFFAVYDYAPDIVTRHYPSTMGIWTVRFNRCMSTPVGQVPNMIGYALKFTGPLVPSFTATITIFLRHCSPDPALNRAAWEHALRCVDPAKCTYTITIDVVKPA